MVFLALPALQRSQRDAQRKQDVAMVVTALHNWKANNKGRGYASMGNNSVLTPLADLNEEQKKYGVNNSIEPIENSPLNSYISFDLKSGKNKNDSSSSLSLNTKIITTSVNNNVTLFRIDSTSFRDHERIAVVVGMGCDNIELASNRSVVLRNIKKGAATVVYLLESGGAYCQEA